MQYRTKFYCIERMQKRTCCSVKDEKIIAVISSKFRKLLFIPHHENVYSVKLSLYKPQSINEPSLKV